MKRILMALISMNIWLGMQAMERNALALKRPEKKPITIDALTIWYNKHFKNLPQEIPFPGLADEANKKLAGNLNKNSQTVSRKPVPIDSNDDEPTTYAGAIAAIAGLLKDKPALQQKYLYNRQNPYKKSKKKPAVNNPAQSPKKQEIVKCPCCGFKGDNEAVTGHYDRIHDRTKRA